MKKFKTTCAIILNKNNEVLLIRRGREPFKDFWALISGIGESKKGLSSDESIIGEIAWDLGTKSFVGNRVFSLPIENDEITDEVIVYAGHINESEILLRPGYSEEIKWVSFEQAMQQRLAFEHVKIIEKYLAQRN